MAGLTTFTADGAKVEVRGKVGSIDSGSDYWEVPGIASWTEGGGDTPTRDVVAFEGTATQSGAVRPQSIECEVSAYAPNHRAWRLIRAAAVGGNTLSFRLTTPRNVIDPGGSAARKLGASSAGQLSITGTSMADFLAEWVAGTYTVGMVVEVEDGSTNPASLVIESIPATPTAINAATVTKPSAAVAATDDYRIVIPSLRRGPFNATVATADRSTLRAEADLSAGLTLQAVSVLPAYTMVAGAAL